VLGAVLAAVLLAVGVPPAARADVAGPVVLLGTGGVRWADVDDSTPALKQLLQQDSAGLLAVRSVRSIACPSDGWLAVSAGRRAGDQAVGFRAGQRDVPSCREPEVTGTPGAQGTVGHWADYLAQAGRDSFDAHPGLLGDTLAANGRTSAAVGPGAAIALADRQGRVAHAWPGQNLAPEVRAALATSPHLVAVDLGAVLDPDRQAADEPPLTGEYAQPKAAQVRALDARLGAVLAELPATATVIVAATADSGSLPPSQMQLLAARGPAPLGGEFRGSLLGTESTRQDGIAQTTDLLPTLLAALSVPIPADAVGSALEPVQQQRSAPERARKLDDLALASSEVTPIVPWIFNGLVVSQILLYGVVTLLLRRRSTAGSGRRRMLGGLRRAAVVFASFPAATFLANLLPWWRADSPRWAVTGAVVLFMAPISMLALLGPWRRALLGPMGAVGAATALILATDAATGSHLILSSLMGVQPYIAGRFYGFSNPAFALFATGALLAAISLADALVRRDRRREAVTAVVVIGLLATVIDGAPGIGSDFGGPPAIIPAFAVLALMVAGVRITWPRVLLIIGVTLAVIVSLSVIDWLRPADQRTHLGRFVESVIHGGAWPVIHRKAAQNIDILFTSWLSALLPVAAAFVFFVLAKPVAWGVRPLQLAYNRSPVLRLGLIAFGVMMVLGWALNDSGPAVPADAATVAIPLLIAASVRALELQDDPAPEPVATPG
jgi:hypothetical protein